MKIPQAVLGAILVGVAVQATSCKKEDPKPREKKVTEQGLPGTPAKPANCPACGLG